MNYNHYKELIQNIGNLFLDESRKNVTFVFKGSDEKITAHKCILEAASPVFKAMFSGNFAETDEVEIDDISPEVFKLLLSGIYLNDIHSQVTKDESAALHCYANLYYAAEKYDIKDIRELSKMFMIYNCHEGNTNLLLNKAKLFNLSELEAKCKEVFKKRTLFVFASHIDHNVNNGYFHEFFDLDNFTAETEFDLYMGLQAMVENKVLLDYSKCLSKIRFLSMKTTDILKCKLLSANDKVAIIANIEAQQLRETPLFTMPAHLSVEKNSRKFTAPCLFEAHFFWTAIMLKSVKYEDYLEEFFKVMDTSTELKGRNKALINKGRNEKDKNGRVSYDVVADITRKCYYKH